MATFTFFHEAKKYIGDATIDLDGHTFKYRLTNVAPTVATDTEAATFTAITGGSYADGACNKTWTETGAGVGTWRFADDHDPSWTASGSDFTTFRYVVLFDDTPSGTPTDPVIGYWDVGSQTITNGSTFTLNLDANYAIFELS